MLHQSRVVVAVENQVRFSKYDINIQRNIQIFSTITFDLNYFEYFMSLLWWNGFATSEEPKVTKQSFFGGLKVLDQGNHQRTNKFIQKVRSNILNKILIHCTVILISNISKSYLHPLIHIGF